MFSFVSPATSLNYTFSQVATDFASAQKVCNDLGAHLVAYGDITEQQVRAPSALGRFVQSQHMYARIAWLQLADPVVWPCPPFCRASRLTSSATTICSLASIGTIGWDSRPAKQATGPPGCGWIRACRAQQVGNTAECHHIMWLLNACNVARSSMFARCAAA